MQVDPISWLLRGQGGRTGESKFHFDVELAEHEHPNFHVKTIFFLQRFEAGAQAEG